jgi:hypothetical protein
MPWETLVREVAAELGISNHHCYRERAEICRRVARYIYDHDSLSPLAAQARDEFRLLVEQLQYRTIFSDIKSANRALNELVALAPSPEQKVQAMRAAASSAIKLGNLQWAERAYARAVAVVAGLASEQSTSAEAARAYLDLFGHTLANCRRDNAEGLRLAVRAVGRLEPLHASAAPHVRELYIESLLALAANLWNAGQTEAAHGQLVRADPMLPNLPTLPFVLRVQVAGALWRLRDYLLLTGNAYYPNQQRLEGLTGAFHQALSSGLTQTVLELLAAITGHHAFAGSDDEALRAGRLAIFLAKQQQSPVIEARESVEIAARLLPTKHWEYARSLLPQRPQIDWPNLNYRPLLSYARAECAMRSRQFEGALKLATAAANSAPFSSLTVREQLVGAAAAHALERKGEACALVESALHGAESLRLAPILRDAYHAGATITGDARLKRRAAEVTQLLTE